MARYIFPSNGDLTTAQGFNLASAQYAVNVTDFGAKGDGVTDDTAAIQTAVDSMTSGVIFFPPGTYLVTPTLQADAQYRAVDLGTAGSYKFVGTGRGVSIIKVAANANDYNSIIGETSTAPIPDISYLELSNLTFDQNIDNQTISLTGWRCVLDFRNGDYVSVHDCEIKNSSSMNVFYIGADKVTLSDNWFHHMGDNPSLVNHDAAAVYVHGEKLDITNNVFEGKSATAPLYGAGTAIEIHGRHYTITGNIIDNFSYGICVTGVYDYDSTNVVVSNNIINNCTMGINVVCVTYDTHTSGYGFDGLTITNNEINMTTSPTFGHEYPAGGIYIHYGNTLDIKNMNLSGNIINYTLESVTTEQNVCSIAIGYNCQTAHAVDLVNAVVENNIIVNAPMAGIAFSGNLENVVIRGNQLINCGCTLYAVNAITESPMYIAGGTIKNVTISSNQFVDSNAVTRTIRFLYLQALGTAARFTNLCVVDNEFLVSGDGALYVEPISIYATSDVSSPIPYIRGRIDSFPGTTALQKIALQSEVVDSTNNQTWAIGADQLTWA